MRIIATMRHPAIYIMASGTNGINSTLYIGVTSNLVQRVWQHRTGACDGFTRRYGCTRLVHFEQYDDMLTAIAREKQLKNVTRAQKLALIAVGNPRWRDLYDEIVCPPRPTYIPPSLWRAAPQSIAMPPNPAMDCGPSSRNDEMREFHPPAISANRRSAVAT